MKFISIPLPGSGEVPLCPAFCGRWGCPDFECTLLGNAQLRKQFMGSCSHSQSVVPAFSPWLLRPAVPDHSTEHSSSCFNFFLMFISSCLILNFKSNFEIWFYGSNENFLQKEIFRKCNLLIRGKVPMFSVNDFQDDRLVAVFIFTLKKILFPGKIESSWEMARIGLYFRFQTSVFEAEVHLSGVHNCLQISSKSLFF